MIIELLKYTCIELDKKNIEYMLSGSVAMNLYATPRMTRDIDIVINLKKEDTEKFLSVFSGHYYFNPDTIATEIEKGGMFNILDKETGYKIDFMIKKNSPFRQTEFDRKQRIKVFDFEAWVVSVEDLIISKLIWTQTHVSERQIQDARNLLVSRKMDTAYIQKWCKAMKLETFNLL